MSIYTYISALHTIPWMIWLPFRLEYSTTWKAFKELLSNNTSTLNLDNIKSSFTGMVKSDTITTLSGHLSFHKATLVANSVKVSHLFHDNAAHFFYFLRKGSTKTIMLVDHKQNHGIDVGHDVLLLPNFRITTMTP